MPCAAAWHERHVFSVTGRSPAAAAFAPSRITASGAYSLPGPWHDSQPTPSAGSNVFATAAPAPPPVRWHFRQAGAAWGSPATPDCFAIAAARSVASVA